VETPHALSAAALSLVRHPTLPSALAAMRFGRFNNKFESSKRGEFVY
jgi:hypothetical protein